MHTSTCSTEPSPGVSQGPWPPVCSEGACWSVFLFYFWLEQILNVRRASAEGGFVTQQWLCFTLVPLLITQLCLLTVCVYCVVDTVCTLSAYLTWCLYKQVCCWCKPINCNFCWWPSGLKEFKGKLEQTEEPEEPEIDFSALTDDKWTLEGEMFWPQQLC